MFAIPGFDPKTFSNEELFEKQLDLVSKKILASRFSNYDALNQLQLMIDAIDQERRERMFAERIGSYMVSTPSVVVESDPVLKARDNMASEAETEKQIKAAPARPIRKPIRTARPVKPTDAKL